MIKKFEEPIYVTKPLLPEKNDIYRLIDEVLDSKWLTNHGEKHNLFEEKLTSVLGVNYASVFNNGAIALLVALRALNVREGEVITTPFTFAATTHAIAWNGLDPVFCDIRPDTMCIDEAKIEKLITTKTRAIMPVHVYGFPCDVYKIKDIADKYNLKVIYDGAHVFGSTIDGIPIGNFGDISMFSFHATKLFNSIEGGCLTYNDEKLKQKIYLLRNFGIKNEEEVTDIGINGKMNEIQACFGLLNLDLYKDEQEKRAKIFKLYNSRLSEVKGIEVPQMPYNADNSYQYYVIKINEEYGLTRDNLYDELKKYNIYSRKYFYPICSDFEPYKHLPSAHPSHLPVANDLKNKVLTLPFYGDLSEDDINKICDLITVVGSRINV